MSVVGGKVGRLEGGWEVEMERAALSLFNAWCLAEFATRVRDFPTYGRRDHHESLRVVAEGQDD